MSRLPRPSYARASLATLFIALLAALPASAQTIYKVQMPDGSILFTDAPPQGGKILEEREARSTPRPVRSTASGTAQTPLPGTSSEPTRATPQALTRAQALEAAVAEINAAEAGLTAAQRRLELGREPLPGERLGLAGGGSRLSPEYHERIAGLERGVAEAEERLKRAHAARNAAR